MKLYGMEISKNRISEDEIEITADGKYVGNIGVGWLRLGGMGWTLHGISRTFKTQKEGLLHYHIP